MLDATMFVGPSGATSSSLSTENMAVTPSTLRPGSSTAIAVARTIYGVSSRDTSRAPGLSFVMLSSKVVVSRSTDHLWYTSGHVTGCECSISFDLATSMSARRGANSASSAASCISTGSPTSIHSASISRLTAN